MVTQFLLSPKLHKSSVGFSQFLFCFVTFSLCLAGMKAANKAQQLVDYSLDQAVSKDLVLFEFKKLEVATSDFLAINKLGQGGFGPVYKVPVSMCT